MRESPAPRAAASQTGLADTEVVDARKQYCFVIKLINFTARPHPGTTQKRQVVRNQLQRTGKSDEADVKQLKGKSSDKHASKM